MLAIKSRKHTVAGKSKYFGQSMGMKSFRCKNALLMRAFMRNVRKGQKELLNIEYFTFFLYSIGLKYRVKYPSSKISNLESLNLRRYTSLDLINFDN